GCQTVLGRRGRRDRADGGDGHPAAPGAALLLGEELGEVARGGRARERHGVDRARGERLPQAAGAVLDAPGLVGRHLAYRRAEPSPRAATRRSTITEPFALVETTHVNVSGASSAASSGSQDWGGSIAIVGACSTRAPASSRSCTKRWACGAARVTTIVRRWSGRVPPTRVTLFTDSPRLRLRLALPPPPHTLSAVTVAAPLASSVSARRRPRFSLSCGVPLSAPRSTCRPSSLAT